jgi:hypothetical protein
MKCYFLHITDPWPFCFSPFLFSVIYLFFLPFVFFFFFFGGGGGGGLTLGTNIF